MTYLTAEQTVKFINESNVDLAKLKEAFELLNAVPKMAKEVFGHCQNLEKLFAEKTDLALYRCWTNVFSGALTENVLAFNTTALHKAFHNEINVENVELVEALIANEVNAKELLTEWLAVIGLDKFKTTMKVEPDHSYSDRVNRDGLTADVLYIASVMKGIESNLPQMKTAVKTMSKMNNWKHLEALDIELSMAQNGNLTIKMPKDLVNLLNQQIV